MAADDIELGVADYLANPDEPILPRLRESLFYGVQQQPDVQAKMRAYSKRLGVPLPAALGDADYVKPVGQVEDLDPNGMILGTPKTANWLAQPDNAAIAHDDIPSLGAIETLSKALSNIGKGIKQRDLELQAGGRRVAAALEDLDPFEGARERLRQLGVPIPTTDHKTRLTGEARALETAAKDTGYEQGTTWEDVKQRPLAEFLPFAIEQGLVSIPDMVGSLAALPLYVTTRTGEIGQKRAVNDERKDATVGDLVAAMPAAVASSMLERIGTKGIIGIDEAVAKGVGGVIKETGKAAVKEGVTEAGQEAIETAGETVGTKAKVDLGQVADRIAAAAVGGAGFGGTVRGVTASVQATANTARERQAKVESSQEQVQVVSDLMAAAQGSALRQRSPGTFEEFVAAATEGTPVEKVYVNANDLVEALAQGGPEELKQNAQIAQAMPSVVKQLQDATSSNGLVEIPVSELLAYTPDTALAQALMQNLKVDPNGMSMREAEVFMQEQAEGLKAEVAKAVEQGVAEDAMSQSAEVVRQNIQAQLDTVNRFTADINQAYSSLVSTFYATQAARLGITPEQLFEQHPLTIKAAGVGPEVFTHQDDGNPPRLPGSASLARPPIPTAEQMAEFGRVEEVPLSQARSGQRRRYWDEFNAGEHPGELIDGYGDMPVAVRREDGEYVLMDGHHRTEKAMAEGATSLPMHVIDAKAYAPDVAGVAPRQEGWTDADEALLAELRDMGFQQSVARQPNLVAVHNITADKLANVDKIGGMAAPSFAVVHADQVLDGFGDITLVAAPDMIDPKTGQAVKIFGADIYSLRYPDVVNELDQKATRALADRMREGVKLTEGRFDSDDFANPGRGSSLAQVLAEKNYAMAAFLLENSTEPQIVRYDDNNAVNSYATKRALQEQIGEQLDDFHAWTQELTANLVLRERIFDGFTNSGNRRYLPHNLDTVIKLLKRDMRGGEGWNYGVPNIRAKVTPQFKSMKAIIKAEDRIVTKEAFEKVKEEVEQEFMALAESLQEKSPWGKEFGYLNTFSHQLSEAAEFKRADVLQTYFDNSLTQPELAKVATFLAKLADMPTEYFEGKWLRAVDVKEFHGALVPTDADPAVVERLAKQGLRTVPYDRNVPGDRNRAIKEFREVFFQDTPGEARGTFQPSTNTIVLLRNADLSTFLHETGHFYLETLARLAAEPGAPDALRQDWDRAAAFIGVEGADPASWLIASVDERREGHETWARAFEAYLREGKAPAQGLANLFRRFKSWLVHVYQTLAQLNVELTDEVRGVFDRLLATDEEIKKAELGRSFAPVFDSKPEGVSDQEWAAYQALGAEATATAQEELAARSMRDMRWLSGQRLRMIRDLTREAREKRKAVKAEITTEVMGEPVYAAQQFLRRGTTPDGEPWEGAHKLRIEDVAAIYEGTPAELQDWRRLGFGKYGMLAEDGLNPDQAAELFGFTSGHEMVEALLNAEPVREVIEGRTDQRMLERYGDLADENAIERAADEAIHNEARLRFVAAEANALATAAGKKRVLAEAARNFAAELVARQRIRDLKPGKYTGAETRAAAAAAKAAAKGDLVLAATEKRNQLINAYAAKAAYEAQADVEKAMRYLKRFESAATRKGMDPDYRDQIDALLERFDLRTGQSLKAIDKRKSLKTWIEGQQAKGLEPIIDEQLVNEAYRKHFRDLTVEELRGLVDAVKNIAHLGRLKNKLLVAAQQRAFQSVVDEAETLIRDQAYKTLPVKLENNTVADRALSGFANFFAIHRKFSSLVREMSGLKNDGGILWRAFIEPMNAANDKEAAMREQATIQLAEVLKPIASRRGDLRKKLYIPEIGKSLTLEGRLAVALNWGNELNRARIMDGDKWSDAQVGAILGTLTPQQLGFVNTMWEYLDSFWPEIAAKERRITGVEPVKVEAEPFELVASDGSIVQMRGGYYPIKYDTERSSRSEADEVAESVRAALRGAYTRATTRRGHTKARVEKVERPVRKDLMVPFQHVNQVIHDLAFHEYLIDANRLISAAPIDAAIRDHYGVEVLRTIKKTLDDIAEGDTAAETSLERAMNYVRTGTTIVGLGWNLTTGLLQPLGLTQSIVRIGPKYMAKGIGKAFADAASLQNTVEQIGEKSDFMRLRAKTFMREINEVQNQVKDSIKPAAWGPVENSFFFLIQKLQLVADMPTWLGAYAKAQDAGHDEKSAVALADQAVRDSQGGGQIGDLAQIQRGNVWFKLWTNFYSFFNIGYNQMAESLAETRRVGAARLPYLAADVLLVAVVPVVLGELMKNALRGEEWDWEELGPELAKAQVSYLLGFMVGLRELGGMITSDGKAISGPASLRLLTQDLPRLYTQVQQGELDDSLRKSALNVAGVLFHFPAGQINRTIDGIEALAKGETKNPLAVLVGPPRD